MRYTSSKTTTNTAQLDTMTLLKAEQKPSMLTLYEQLFIPNYHYNGHLIPEQNTDDSNSPLQLIDTIPKLKTQ
jgi:hypothetical protein